MITQRLSETVTGLLLAALLTIGFHVQSTSGALAGAKDGTFQVAQALTPEEKAAERKRKQLERQLKRQQKQKEAQERKRQRQQQAAERRRQQQANQKANQAKRKQQQQQAAERRRQQQAQQKAKRAEQQKKAAERRRQQQAQQKANQAKRKQQQQQAAERRRQAEENKKLRKAEQARKKQEAAERRRAEQAKKAAERNQSKDQKKATQAERQRQAEERKQKRQAERERKKQEAAERRRNQQNQTATDQKTRKEQQKAKQEERRLQAEERKKQRQQKQNANKEQRQQQATEAQRRRLEAREAAAKKKRERVRARLDARAQRKLRRQEQRIQRANARRQRQLERAAAGNTDPTARVQGQRAQLRQQLQNNNRQAQRRERQQRLAERQRNWERRQARGERRNRRRDFGFNRRARVIERRDDRVILSGIVGAAAGALATALFIQHNDDRRFGWRADDYYVEPVGDGWTRTVVRRPDGSRIVTIRDSSGVPVRRSRIYPDGRRVLYFNNQPTWWDDEDLYVDVEPVRVSIPREEYVVEPSAAPVERIYSTVTAGPVDQLDRTYTLNQILVNPRLRNYMPRIDLDTITFASGSSEIPTEQIDKLDTIGVAIEQAIKDNPKEMFLVEGHTDATGTDVANLELSDQRASSIADALTSYFGIPPENLITQGYGEQFLKVDTARAEQANRRVAIRRITPLLSTSNDQITYDEDGNEIFNN